MKKRRLSRVIFIIFLILLSILILYHLFWIFIIQVDVIESPAYVKWSIMKPYYESRQIDKGYYEGGFFHKYVYQDRNYLRTWPASPCLTRTSLGQLCKFTTIKANVNINTFETISYSYSKDKDKVYYLLREIKDADPNTFEVIFSPILQDIFYTKDKNNVYYGTSNIEGADVNTFRLINNTYTGAIDKNNVYFNGEPVKIFDASTFYVYPESVPYLYVKDKNNVYYIDQINGNGVIMKITDVGSFNYNWTDHTFRDKNFIYSQGRVVSRVNISADPSLELAENFSFKPLGTKTQDPQYSKSFKISAMIQNLFC